MITAIKNRLIRRLRKLLEESQESERQRALLAAAETHPTARISASAQIMNGLDRSAIRIGQESWLEGTLLTYAPNGKIDIGDHCYIGRHSQIWSANQIKIGNRVLISHNVNIHDTNSHAVESAIRHQHYLHSFRSGASAPGLDFAVKTAPITIEDDAWIGFNSIILKGVRIGRGSIVSAGAVVVKDVPDGVLVAGNPAVVVRRLA